MELTLMAELPDSGQQWMVRAGAYPQIRQILQRFPARLRVSKLSSSTSQQHIFML